MKHSIVIADDDSRVLTALKLLLKGEQYDVVTAASPAELLRILERRDFSVALIDLNYEKDTTSGKEGLQLISDIKALNDALPIVVMTGYSSVDIAVEAMKLGASDFVQKPWGNDRLLSIIHSQILIKESQKKGAKLAHENALLKHELYPQGDAIVAESETMKRVKTQLEKLALSDMNILLTGENGTGKSMLAEYLHSCSARADASCISVNMGAISDSLFESEMFGHIKGAFTDAKDNRIGRFELAEGGTLFLDEIANIKPEQQAKLLRVLESMQFEKVGSSHTQIANVRLVSATNADLAQQVEEGQFRQDLLYRLNTVEIEIPPLRERKEDILALASYFLDKHGHKYGLESVVFDPEAKSALLNYHWPGNIRELNHMIERAIFLCHDNMIKSADLGLESSGDNAFDMSEATLDEIEKHIIAERLARFNKNCQQTSTSLGLSRSAYYRRLEKYGF